MALCPSTRKWNIAIIEKNFHEIQSFLHKTKENMKELSNSLRYHLHISFNNHRHHKIIPDHSFREKVLTWLADEWSIHIVTLSFILYNDEGFLFDNKFTFPNLEHLCIKQSRKNTYSFLNSFDHALDMYGCQLRETLIGRHASSLQYLEVHGNWKLDLDGRKLAAVHTNSMTQPTTQSFNQLINKCGLSLRTLIIKAAQDEYIYDETDTLMPNIANIYLDSSWTSWYRLIVAYSGQLTTLKISSDDYAFVDIGVQPPNLKTLCVRNETHGMHVVSLLEKCVDSLECLIVDRYNFDPVYLPNLTDLYVLKREMEEAGDPCNLFNLLQINKHSLQFLFVSDNKPSLYNDTGIEDLSGQLPNLQTVLLPGCVNDQLIRICLTQLKSGDQLRVFTFREEVNEEVSRRSQNKYSILSPYLKSDYNVHSLS